MSPLSGAKMPFKYGTLETRPVEEKSALKSKMLALFIGVVAVAGLATVGFKSGFVQVKSAVNSNFNRRNVAVVAEDVTDMFEAACTDIETRFVLATFDSDRTSIVPAVQGSASYNWERDFQAFQNALPAHEEVAFAVYNFPVWNEDGKSFEVIPTFVTYLAPDADPSSMYLGGAYLGGAALAAACTGKNTIKVDRGMSYVDACERLTGDARRCRAVSDQECPFHGEGTPCTDECSYVTNFAVGEMDEACCDAIDKYCANVGHKGCSNYAMSIYKQHCGGVYELHESQNKLLEAYADEEDKCLPKCQSPCTIVADGADDAETYKACSGCATDGAKYTYADGDYAANCYPGQYKFQEQRCCGAGCGHFSNEDSCDSMPDIDLGCVWSTHEDCAASLGAAAAAASEAADAAEAAELAAAGIEVEAVEGR